jgi:SAM-dependent methyltransferase
MSVPYIHDEITHNSGAASQVLPVLFEVFKPQSILDVGCGLGNWIEVAKKMGVPEVIGVDGDYVNRSLLKIEAAEFVERDLKQPFDLNRKFDVSICLEVAEHLPASSADGLIQSLTKHSDVILFSAALPGQGGQNHINEQWPSYWQTYFAKYGFEMIDYFRPKIWNNQKIDRWYRQNIFLVVKKGHDLSTLGNNQALSLIHPELFEVVNENHELKIKQLRATIEKLKSRDLVGKITGLFKKK